MAISRELLQKLLHLLRPYMEDKKERKGYLFRALTDAPVLNRLDWDMPVDAFITDMVNKLADFVEITPGKPALYILLEEVRKEVGVDIKIHFDELMAEFVQIQTPSHLLFDLRQMDFKQQVQLVTKVMESHRIAAFLVDGEPYCGQQLLVTRLFRLKPQWKNISPIIQIDLSHNGVGKSIPHLWRQLTSWFGLPKDAQPNEIIERVCDHLLTQDVIFIFYPVDYMLPKVLTAWLQEFWEPLVERVDQNFRLTPEGTHLLMFLVDNSGSGC